MFDLCQALILCIDYIYDFISSCEIVFENCWIICGTALATWSKQKNI